MKINEISGANNVVKPAKPAKPVETSKETRTVEKKITNVNTDSREDVKNENIINDEMLDKSIKQANKSLANFDKFIERSIHEKTKTVMYVIKDSKTNEVIKEFPPKKIQDMIAKMWELAGLFVDEKA